MARCLGLRTISPAVIVFRPLFLVLRVTAFYDITHQHMVCVVRLHVTATYVQVVHVNLHDHRNTSLNNTSTTGSTRISSSSESPDRIRDPSTLLFCGCSYLFSGIKWPGLEANHSHPSSARLRVEHNLSSPYAFMAFVRNYYYYYYF